MPFHPSLSLVVLVLLHVIARNHAFMSSHWYSVRVWEMLSLNADVEVPLFNHFVALWEQTKEILEYATGGRQGQQ